LIDRSIAIDSLIASLHSQTKNRQQKEKYQNLIVVKSAIMAYRVFLNPLPDILNIILQKFLEGLVTATPMQMQLEILAVLGLFCITVIIIDKGWELEGGLALVAGGSVVTAIALATGATTASVGGTVAVGLLSVASLAAAPAAALVGGVSVAALGAGILLKGGYRWAFNIDKPDRKDWSFITLSIFP